MKRRTFLAGLGSAVVWPIASRAQQPDRVRRIGVMLGFLAADDPEAMARLTAFIQKLQERGWTDRRNVASTTGGVWVILTDCNDLQQN
jgi:putative tryptophan/tyrosine transport system substrate-binding protein